MVRRLLWAALATMLAVALPAAADEASPSDPSSDPLSSACSSLAASLCASTAFAVAPGYEGGEEGACEAWEINTPGSGAPLTETLVVDPDGCIRGVVRRILDWPPVETHVDGRILPGSSSPVLNSILD